MNADIVTNGFWRDRSVLVTGATGLLGGWLVGRLLEQGASVVCLVRDWVPQCELLRTIAWRRAFFSAAAASHAAGVR